MSTRMLGATLLGLVLLAGTAAAHEGHDHKVMGTVAAVDEKHVEVTGADGQKTSVDLAPETKYLHGGMAAERSFVSVGQRVVVVFRQDEKAKTNVAKEVRLGVKDKAKKPVPPKSEKIQH